MIKYNLICIDKRFIADVIHVNLVSPYSKYLHSNRKSLNKYTLVHTHTNNKSILFYDFDLHGMIPYAEATEASFPYAFFFFIRIKLYQIKIEKYSLFELRGRQNNGSQEIYLLSV